MLPEQKVKIKIGTKNKTYYNNLGYEGKLGDEILVDINHVTNGTWATITAICDYCGKPNHNISFSVYNRQMNKTPVKKYACGECKHLKQQEVYFALYGTYTYNGVTIERAKKEFEDRDYILLTTEFKTTYPSREYLTYICKKHPEHEQQIVYNSFQRGSGCKYCGFEKIGQFKKHSFDFVKNEFDKRDYVLLENEYINSDVKMKYICKKHPDIIQEISFTDLYNANHGCKYCGIEKSRNAKVLGIDKAREIYHERGLVLLEDEYINNTTPMKYICLNHPNIIQEDSLSTITARKKYSCRFCYLDNHKGENSSSWKGGITPLQNHLRHFILPWKKDSLANSNYKCVFTGERFDIIHHLYGFEFIIQEILEELKIPLFPQINYYTKEELKNIEDKCLELHYKYGFGLCLKNNIHDLFHHEYGKGKNTPEQFEEFAQRYYNGEFDNLINLAS